MGVICSLQHPSPVRFGRVTRNCPNRAPFSGREPILQIRHVPVPRTQMELFIPEHLLRDSGLVTSTSGPQLLTFAEVTDR